MISYEILGFWFFFPQFFLKLFLAVPGLPSCVQAFSSGGERELLPSCSAAAYHRSGFSCRRAQALEFTSFSSCDAWVSLPHGMWNLP